MERLAQDKDPYNFLRRVRVRKVAAHHFFLIKIMHLPLIGEPEGLNRPIALGEVVAVDMPPRAHVLRCVAHAVEPKGADVRAREVRLEYSGAAGPYGVPPLAPVVTPAWSLEGVQ